VIETIGILMIGAAAGGGFGAMFGRASCCGQQSCPTGPAKRLRMIVSIAAGAFFGAAVAWQFAGG
jgi:hypothetical protein